MILSRSPVMSWHLLPLAEGSWDRIQPSCDPLLRDKALDNGWVFVLTHLSGIPVLRNCSILASILANEFF